MGRNRDGFLSEGPAPEHDIKHLSDQGWHGGASFIIAGLAATVAIDTVAVIARLTERIDYAVAAPGNRTIRAACGVGHIAVPLPRIAHFSELHNAVTAE